MYSYTYSEKTGGLLLNDQQDGFSKEPRPVYAPELDLLGFDKYWSYDKQSHTPYMWAEAHRYYYRGRLVASLLGGDVYHAPVIQLAYVCTDWKESKNGKTIVKTICGAPNKGDTFTDKYGNLFTLDLPEKKGGLHPIDISTMVEENRNALDWIKKTTEKKILNVYEKYAGKLDLFHVAFSGGKDSCVLLDLVKNTLPKDSFVIVFGDTGMEFPDTYDVINKVEKQCQAGDIKFYRASSHLSPQESWELFAPPSRVLRWCCSVHKTAPQILKLREVTGKLNYTGLDYVGVRAHESVLRSGYEYENYGKKQKGQYSHNPILEWTSAEIWLYMYTHCIIINEGYKKGNSRAGCVFCPMAGENVEYIVRKRYPIATDMYINNIMSRYAHDKRHKPNAMSFIINGGWKARKNGRELTNNDFRCIERREKGYLNIDIRKPSSSWEEWIKTIDEEQIEFTVMNTKNGYTVQINVSHNNPNLTIIKLFRQVFYKATFCIGCRVCEANCRYGCISFENSQVKITNCIKCTECHKIDSGCLMYHSLRHPQGGDRSMKSLNSFAGHAPKPDWFRLFFELKENFFIEHTLGPQAYDFFRRFLKDAGLNQKNHFTPFAEFIATIGWDNATAMGLIYINLVNDNPQIEWYIQNLDIGLIYQRKVVEQMLIDRDVKLNDAKFICNAFKRLTLTPLGTKLNFGYVADNGDMARTTCTVTDPRVILYALYKFAEKCKNYHEFTLSALLDDSIERDGISPTRIFGLDREAMVPILLGLSGRYPEYINATFTHDLDKISLMRDKTSEDVLRLFEKEGDNGR